jgi:hypothetical protein
MRSTRLIADEKERCRMTRSTATTQDSRVPRIIAVVMTALAMIAAAGNAAVRAVSRDG